MSQPNKAAHPATKASSIARILTDRRRIMIIHFTRDPLNFKLRHYLSEGFASKVANNSEWSTRSVDMTLARPFKAG
jgi:hypothetical protein